MTRIRIRLIAAAALLAAAPFAQAQAQAWPTRPVRIEASADEGAALLRIATAAQLAATDRPTAV